MIGNKAVVLEPVSLRLALAQKRLRIVRAFPARGFFGDAFDIFQETHRGDPRMLIFGVCGLLSNGSRTVEFHFCCVPPSARLRASRPLRRPFSGAETAALVARRAEKRLLRRPWITMPSLCELATPCARFLTDRGGGTCFIVRSERSARGLEKCNVAGPWPVIRSALRATAAPARLAFISSHRAASVHTRASSSNWSRTSGVSASSACLAHSREYCQYFSASLRMEWA